MYILKYTSKKGYKSGLLCKTTLTTLTYPDHPDHLPFRLGGR
jgi:hypothetical protein